ncbi:MAG: amidohydrolase family protein, partial [Synergistota bacterium]|nr:amidohydrolase family protein [Synergistota bacterium]
GDGDLWIRYGGYKMFLDGSLGGRTAAMTFDYADEPSNRGTLNHTQEQVNDMLLEAHSRGIQAQVHAIGDAAVDQFITAAEKAMETGPNSCGLPHRIVHLQVCRPDQMEKLKRLGAVCDIQPSFVPSDIWIAGDRVGEERMHWAYAWRSMMETGLTVTGSSDNPVEPTNPWRGVWAAMNRVDDNGNPEGGWLPGQKLTLDQALTIYCVNAHKAVATDDVLGRLAPGMLADLTVLDRNVEETAPGDLLNVKTVLTMVEGRATFGEIEGV